MTSKRGKEKPQRFVALRHWVMDTAAWRDLDTVARAAYVEPAREYNGSNNGRIAFSLSQMANELHIGKATAMRALERLEDHGFIVCRRRGRFDRKSRHASEWRLTEYNDDVKDALASREFTRWQKPNRVPR